MKKLCRIQWMFLVMVCGFSLAASSQTVPNPVQMESESKGKIKLSAAISLGINYQTGNSKNGSPFVQTFALSAMDSIKKFSLNTKHHYNQNTRKVNKEEFLGGLQFDYHPLSRFSPIARIELYSNRVRQINRRFSGLLGVKYFYFKHLKDNAITSEYSINGAFVFENNNYSKEALLPNKSRLRLSVRPQFKQSVTKNIFLGFESFYKPDIVDFSDFISDSMFQINYVFNKNISLLCSYRYEYDSRPATTTIKKTDTSLLASVVLKL